MRVPKRAFNGNNLLRNCELFTGFVEKRKYFNVLDFSIDFIILCQSSNRDENGGQAGQNTD